MAQINSPCLGCEHRTTTCHGTCEKYLQYYEECRKENKAREIQQRQLGYMVDDIRRIQKKYGWKRK